MSIAVRILMRLTFQRKSLLLLFFLLESKVPTMMILLPAFFLLVLGNNPLTATVVTNSVGPGQAGSIASGQEQWWTFALSAGDRFFAELLFTHANGDLELGLYRSCTGTTSVTCTSVATSFSSTDNEFVETTSAPASGNYWLRVTGFSGAANTYTISFGRGICSFPTIQQYAVGPGATRCFTTSTGANGLVFDMGRGSLRTTASAITDSYALSSGTVDVDQSSADCAGYINTANGPSVIGTAVTQYSTGFYTISAGRQAVVRITCNNFVTNCDITLSAPTFVCSVFQSLSPISTIAPTLTPTSAPTAVTTAPVCSGGFCCNCNCCAGFGCGPAIPVGSVTVSACSQCDASFCTTQFPASCPATNSIRQASCSSSSTTSPSGTTTSPSGTTVAYVTYDAVGCTGNIVGQGSVVLSDNQCIPTTAFGSTINSLQAVGLSSSTGTLTLCSSTDCTTGCNSASVTSGVCADSTVLGGSGRFTWTSTGAGGGPGKCFHTDTVITYAGKDYTLEQLRSHDECSIPHVVRAYGVNVTAKCGNTEKTLRLTDGHLVYTQRGLQAAGDLKPGQDTVYADIAETLECQITSVTKEHLQHEYFGLNCLSSQVLASGLKASTFEKLHSLPAFWMSVVGRILGIARASAIGDQIEQIVSKLNLI